MRLSQEFPPFAAKRMLVIPLNQGNTITPCPRNIFRFKMRCRLYTSKTPIIMAEGPMEEGFSQGQKNLWGCGYRMPHIHRQTWDLVGEGRATEGLPLVMRYRKIVTPTWADVLEKLIGTQTPWGVSSYHGASEKGKEGQFPQSQVSNLGRTFQQLFQEEKNPVPSAVPLWSSPLKHPPLPLTYRNVIYMTLHDVREPWVLFLLKLELNVLQWVVLAAQSLPEVEAARRAPTFSFLPHLESHSGFGKWQWNTTTPAYWTGDILCLPKADGSVQALAWYLFTRWGVQSVQKHWHIKPLLQDSNAGLNHPSTW